MKTKRLITMGAVLSIALSLLLVWISAANPEDGSLESLFASAGIQRVSPPVEAPDFTLKNLEGSEVSLKNFEGKVVFLNSLFGFDKELQKCIICNNYAPNPTKRETIPEQNESSG